MKFLFLIARCRELGRVRTLLWELTLLWVVFITVAIIPLTGTAAASEIAPIVVEQVNNEVIITTALQPDQKLIDDLDSGLSKELVFYVDLFRHWHIWPDEFVLGKRIVRVLQSDPIKREYIGTSTEGNVRTIKRFKDLGSMVAWAMNVFDFKLTNVKALEADDYYIKVTVESNLKKLPPVIGYLLFFTPTKEFSLSKNSNLFRISGHDREAR
ncbi:MAG TPA: DUF4390 domain-containing protein [Dissulfurispiraceae bacterium]|nr:DUF4390 domain-containing protein [Dissulfurispiraceae bacterium]